METNDVSILAVSPASGGLWLLDLKIDYRDALIDFSYDAKRRGR